MGRERRGAKTTEYSLECPGEKELVFSIGLGHAGRCGLSAGGS